MIEKCWGWHGQKWVWPLWSQDSKIGCISRNYFWCVYKFRKAKSSFNNFWVVVVKNGCGLLGFVTRKSAVSQESVDEVSWFFVCWYKFRKAKSFFNNFWVVVVKNGCGSCSSCDSKICCISRIRWWSELIFCMLIQI